MSTRMQRSGQGLIEYLLLGVAGLVLLSLGVIYGLLALSLLLPGSFSQPPEFFVRIGGLIFVFGALGAALRFVKSLIGRLRGATSELSSMPASSRALALLLSPIAFGLQIAFFLLGWGMLSTGEINGLSDLSKTGLGLIYLFSSLAALGTIGYALQKVRRWRHEDTSAE